MKKMKVYTNKNVKQNVDVESGGGSDKNITIYISTSSNSRCFQRLKIIIYIQLIILIAFLTLTGFISFEGLALFSSDPVPQPAERFHKPDAFARISDIANVTHDPIISTTAVENNDAADRAKIENILKPKSELDEIQFGINDFNEALEDFHHQVVGTLDDLVGNNDSNDNDKSSTFLNILTDRDNVEQLFSPHESDWLPPILVNTDNAPETETPITIFITNSDLKEFSEFEKSERNEDPWVSLTDILGKQSDLNLGLGFSSRHSGEGMNDVSTTEGDFETTLLDFLMKYGQGEIDNSGEKHDKSEDSNEKSIGITEKSQETNETTEVTHEQTDETDEKSLPNLDESYEKMDDDQWFKWSMTETAEDNPEIPKYSNWWEGMFLSNDGDGTDVEDTTGEADDMIQKVPGNGFELYTSTESSDYPLESDYYSYEDDDNDSLTTMLSSLLDDLNADSRDKDEKMVAMTNDQLTSAHQPADKEAELVSGLKTSDEEPCNPETEVYVALSTAFPDWNNKCIDRELYDKATLDEFLRDIERLHG